MEKEKEVIFIHRLREAMIRDIEKKIGVQIGVSNQTTEIQAGFMLGAQYVLNKLREGYSEDEKN